MLLRNAIRRVFGHGAFTLGLAALAWAAILPDARAAAPGEHVWIGPHTFEEGRTFRDDFVANITNPDAWPEILARADVFKGYIMMLPDVPVPGNTEPEMSDAEMTALIQLLEAHDIKVAFEVGGARSAAAGAGVAAANNEYVHLSRWINLGGTIDFLTTDHSMAFALNDWLDTMDPAVSGSMSYEDAVVRDLIQDALDESANYFQRMNELIPGVRFGAIESLGYWYVEHPAGSVYPGTRPDLPKLPFVEIFPYLIQAMQDRGLVLDHFHTDFGYEGAAFDGRLSGTLDYGRIIGVESFVESQGVKSGNIVNAFHDRSVSDPDPAAASQEAFDNTKAFFEGYLNAGRDPAHLVLQTWQPYPNRTGPETEAVTVMYMHRELLTGSNFPALSAYVRVDIAPPEAVEKGAQWRPSGSSEWHEPGSIVRVPRDTGLIEFRDVPEFQTPADVTIELDGNVTLVVSENAATYQDPVPPVPLSPRLLPGVLVGVVLYSMVRVCRRNAGRC